jgi:hypothetical protein
MQLPSLEIALAHFLELEDGYRDVSEGELATRPTDVVVRYHLLEGCGEITASSKNAVLHVPDIPAGIPGIYIFERWEDRSAPGGSDDWQVEQIYVGEAECIRTRWHRYRTGNDKHETEMRAWITSWLSDQSRPRKVHVRLCVWAEVRTPDGVVLYGRLATMNQRVPRRLVEGAVWVGHMDLLGIHFEPRDPRNINPIAFKYEADDVIF